MTKCIIIDDEQPARELIELHLSDLKEFELSAIFDNALDAFNFLQGNAVDLVFLDIEMPKYSGLELIRSLKICPKIILTTAYREYAVEAFELDVVDYLVKPITKERFMKTISKVTLQPIPGSDQLNMSTFNSAYIFLKTGRIQVKVFLKDILYIEGFKDYIKVHTAERTLVVLERLSYMEEKLPEGKFVRIHKSFIVAVNRINRIQSGQVGIGKMILPIGRAYKVNCLKNIFRGSKL